MLTPAVAPRLQKLPVETGRFYTFAVVGNTGDLDVVRIVVRINDKLHAEGASP